MALAELLFFALWLRRKKIDPKPKQVEKSSKIYEKKIVKAFYERERKKAKFLISF